MPRDRFPTPEEYFLEIGLYDEFELRSEDDRLGLLRVYFYVGTLDAFCPECDQHSVFRSTTELPDLGPGVMVRTPAASVEDLIENRKALLPVPTGEADTTSYQNVLEFLLRPKVFQNEFVCSRDSSHQLLFISSIRNGTVQKIGQYPSIADLHLADLAKYRKILGSQYAELARGVGLFTHGIGIGAFVYLRRIFERMVEEAHVEASSQVGWDEDEYQKGRMAEKIKLLHAYLPDYVVENSGVYSIMSKGIHELGEAECQEHFPVVRAALELILDEKLEAKRKAEKIARNQAALSGLSGRLKDRPEAGDS